MTGNFSLQVYFSYDNIIFIQYKLINKINDSKPFPCTPDIKKAHYKILETECIIEPPYEKNNQMACAPSEDSDQPGHQPNLIRVFAVRSVCS